MPSWLSGLIGGIADVAIAAPVNWIVGLFKDFFLTILGQTIIPLLTNVMSYQNFFSNGVNAGWTITRDFANLFFALILLIIAIATVLNVGALDNYTAKRMLPNFIFVALFINFSKAIVGFLIDISQIIMVSFYNSFGPSMTDVIGNASKIAETAAESNTENLIINIFTIVIIAFLTFVLLWTALILAMRIVTLWFVIMLSPLAFMSSLIPGLKGINSEWTKNLQEALITGPTLMFLLYLAFSVMSQGISANTATVGNLMNNGNLINYVLVIGLLFLANTTATKAGQAAPPMLKNAVGVAGTVATFGLGAYVGAGGYNTNQLRKKTLELGDKGIGGVTRGVQIASGGKINPNDRYEMMKKRGKDRIENGQGVENIPFIGSRIKDSRAGKWMSSVAQQTLGGEAGRKENYKSTLVSLAEEAKSKGTLNNNPELKKAYNNNIIEETKKLAEADTSVPELIEKLDKTVESSAKKAILMRITQLQGLAELASNERYRDIVEKAENDSEILEGILNRELNDGELDAEDISFRDRLARVAKDKKQETFVSGINEVVTSTDSDGREVKKSKTQENAKKDKDEVRNLSIKSMGTELKNKRYRFTRRKQIGTDPETGNPIWDTENGKAKRTLDITIFTAGIEREDPRVLRDPETWATYDSDTKEKIKKHIKDLPDTEKTPQLEAALEGLGVKVKASSRVTGDTI
jgi:hypothetical protein